MSRKPTIPPKRSASLTADQIKVGIDRLNKRLEDVRRFQPTSIVEQYNIPEVEGLSVAIDEALERTFGGDTLDYNRYRQASQFDNGPHNYAYEVPIREVQGSLQRSKDRNIALLEQAVNGLTERLNELGIYEGKIGELAKNNPVAENRHVFIVHGHAGAEESVARYLEKIGFTPIVLHEKPNQGKTVIEKFEKNSDVGFAVVLLTDDDVGGVRGGVQGPRARQNVVLELGYFIGRLGRERVCALKKGDIELPTDIVGVIWQELDAQGGWRQALAKELQAAGYKIDWNDVMK